MTYLVSYYSVKLKKKATNKICMLLTATFPRYHILFINAVICRLNTVYLFIFKASLTTAAQCALLAKIALINK